MTFKLPEPPKGPQMGALNALHLSREMARNVRYAHLAADKLVRGEPGTNVYTLREIEVALRKALDCIEQLKGDEELG